MTGSNDRLAPPTEEQGKALYFSTRSHKGALTSLIESAENAIKACGTRARPAQIGELDNLKVKLEKKLDLIQNNTDELARLYTTNAEGYYASLEEVRKHQAATVTRLRHLIMYAAPAPDLSAAPRGTRTAETKLQESLRPKILTKDFNPVEYRNWVRQFKLYYNRSSIDKASIEDQRGLLENCLDTDIQRHLTLQCHNTANIFRTEEDDEDAKSCIEEISSFFLTRYPLISRRFEVLKEKHIRGTQYSKFLMQFINKSDEADFGKATGDQIMVLLAILACNNDELRKEFMKLENPTMTDIIDKTAKFEQIENNLRQTTDTAKTYEVRSERRDRRQPGRGQKKPKGSKKDVCWRCNEPGHIPKDCKMSENITCSHCKKKGHIKAACFTLNKSKAKQVREEESSTSEDDEDRAVAKTVRAGAETPTMLL